VLRRWSNGELACRADAGAIVCHNGSGATISVAAARIAVGL
jgi:hypothetical protein